MVLSQHFATATNFLDATRDKVSGCLDRYRFVAFPVLGAVVAFGIAYNWHWLTRAELMRALTALPCMLMMYKCMRCGLGQRERNAGTPEVADLSHDQFGAEGGKS